MKRKSKIITSVALLSLSIFGLMMGVYAAVSRQLSISGTISFTASTLRASYVVSKTDAFAGETVDYTTEVASGAFNDTNNTDQVAALGDIVLSDAANKFGYKVVITNNESVRTIDVNYTLPTVTEGWLTLYVNGDPATGTPAAITLASGQVATVEFLLVANPLTAPTSVANAVNLASTFTLSLPEAGETFAPEQRALSSDYKQQSQKINDYRNNQTIERMSNDRVNTQNMENTSREVEHVSSQENHFDYDQLQARPRRVTRTEN
jgi:hypothetical protein